MATLQLFAMKHIKSTNLDPLAMATNEEVSFGTKDQVAGLTEEVGCTTLSGRGT